MREKTIVDVVIVDDHTLFRKGLVSILSSFTDVNLVAELENGKRAIAYLSDNDLHPNVILLDINMPEMNGYQTVELIRRKWPNIKVLALSMYNDELSVINMLHKGANGFISKDASPTILHAAIRKLYDTGYFYPEMIKKYLSNDMSLTDKIPEITDREMEFLKYCNKNLTYADIAKHMHISKRTVEKYASSLLEKFELKNRSSLTVLSMKLGLIHNA